MRDVIVFSGNAHRALAKRICEHLGVPLSSVDLQRFSNDCIQAQLLANCRQRDVYIVQPLVPPTQDHLMELLLMVDAARGASAAQITAVMPHYAYARSDKKDASRISLGGRLVADMLATAGVDRVLTMALHAPQVHGFFSVPVDHLTAIGVLADHFRGRDLTDHVVVSPDLGNAKTATQFARLLGLPVAAGNKQRLADDRVDIDSIVGDVAGKPAIVLDDEIATGGSMIGLLDMLAAAGSPRASVVCTHGLFAGQAAQRLQNHPLVAEVLTTDTVPAPANWPELTVRSVAGLFAEAIARIHIGESVSSLFDGVDPRHASPQLSLTFADGLVDDGPGAGPGDIAPSGATLGAPGDGETGVGGPDDSGPGDDEAREGEAGEGSLGAGAVPSPVGAVVGVAGPAGGPDGGSP